MIVIPQWKYIPIIGDLGAVGGGCRQIVLHWRAVIFPGFREVTEIGNKKNRREASKKNE